MNVTKIEKNIDDVKAARILYKDVKRLCKVLLTKFSADTLIINGSGVNYGPAHCASFSGLNTKDFNDGLRGIHADIRERTCALCDVLFDTDGLLEDIKVFEFTNSEIRIEVIYSSNNRKYKFNPSDMCISEIQ